MLVMSTENFIEVFIFSISYILKLFRFIFAFDNDYWINNAK